MKEKLKVIFDGYYNPPIPDEYAKEYVIMPSGSIVVLTETNESFWFDARGKHPKSHLNYIPQKRLAELEKEER